MACETTGCVKTADAGVTPLAISDGPLFISWISPSSGSFPRTVSTLQPEEDDGTHDKVVTRLVELQGHHDDS